MSSILFRSVVILASILAATRVGAAPAARTPSIAQVDAMATTLMTYKLDERTRELARIERALDAITAARATTTISVPATGVAIPVVRPMLPELPLAADETESRLEASIDSGIAAALGNIPEDRRVAVGTKLATSIPVLGVVVNALTVMGSPALGVDRFGGCPNVIVLEKTRRADGTSSVLGSHLTRYYDNVPYPGNRSRRTAAVDALSSVQEGLRCLGNADLAAFEASYARALLSAISQLDADGKRLTALALWDHSLPLTLVLFDAVKYYTTPATLEVLRLPVRLADVGARLAADVRPAVTPFPETMAQLSYCGAGADRLILNRFGAWLEDLRQRGRLTRAQSSALSSWTPCDLLRDLTDLTNLGEGDCPLLEMTRMHLRCPSRDCVGGAVGGPSRLGGAAGLGAFLPLPGGRPPVGLGGQSIALAPSPLAGSRGSRFTHFGTDRATLQKTACGAGPEGGASPVDQCLGRTVDHDAGRFSADPETDRLMSCALEAARAPRETLAQHQARTTQLRPSTICQNVAADDDDGLGTDPALQTSEEQQVQQQRDRELATRVMDNKWGPSSDNLTVITNNLRSVVGTSHVNGGNVAAALAKARGLVAGGNVAIRRGQHLPAGSVGYYHRDHTGRYIDIDDDQISGACGGDAGCIASETNRILSHELGHLVLDVAANGGGSAPVFDETGRQRINGGPNPDPHCQDSGAHCSGNHRFLMRMGVGHECDPSSNNGCTNACGHDDERITRMIQCLEPAGRPYERDCRTAACNSETEPLGASIGVACFGPDPAPTKPEVCAFVTCGLGSTAASGVYATCCQEPASSGGGSAPNRTGCGPTERPGPDGTCLPSMNPQPLPLPGGGGPNPPLPAGSRPLTTLLAIPLR